jgi:hypothetical protein
MPLLGAFGESINTKGLGQDFVLPSFYDFNNKEKDRAIIIGRSNPTMWINWRINSATMFFYQF